MSAEPVESISWNLLWSELDLWAAENRVASFWWRDDDAVAAGPKLERLCKLTRRSGLLLAVIPAGLQNGLDMEIESQPHVWVGQHGYAHINHAPRGQGLGAWELGLHREKETVLKELDVGREILRHTFGRRFLPVVIPPWNHIDPALLSPLVDRGYNGVSFFGSRSASDLRPDFIVANAHCDPVHWKTGPRFTGEAKAVNQLLEHLVIRRNGTVDASEATGILTHHIDLDEASWTFCEQLEQLLTRHPAAEWHDPPTIFGSPP